MLFSEESQDFKKSKQSTFSNGVSPRFWTKNGYFSFWCFLGKLSPK